MSYILNALRKSDAQRRQAPASGQIFAAVGAGPSARRRQRQRRALLLSVLVVMAALVGWQMAEPIRSWWVGTGTDPMPAAPVRAEPTTEAPAVDSAPAASESAIAIDRRAPDQRPASVVSRPAPARPDASPRPPAEREREVADAATLQRLIEAEQAAIRAQAEPSSGSSAAARAEPTEPVLPRPTTQAAAPAATSPAPEAWVPERAEYLRQWELPLTIRRDLPRLSLSIHVFSAEPAQRFVLINGERRVEGDALGQGARLVEIRREGAVVEFRDYRFLLEP